MKWLDVIARIVNAILNAINTKRKKDAVNDPANTIANDGVVLHSDKTISELSKKPNRDGDSR